MWVSPVSYNRAEESDRLRCNYYKWHILAISMSVRSAGFVCNWHVIGCYLLLWPHHFKQLSRNIFFLLSDSPWDETCLRVYPKCACPESTAHVQSALGMRSSPRRSVHHLVFRSDMYMRQWLGMYEDHFAFAHARIAYVLEGVCTHAAQLFIGSLRSGVLYG